MREIVFALEFRGTAGPGPDGRRRARSVAPSQSLTTVLAGDGVRAEVKPLAGESAVLESRVERFADGSFVEDGTIAYGGAGSIAFETIGRGTVGPSPIAGWTYGSVMWTITSGTGTLRGARGLITSNFTVSAAGDVIDDHFVRLYVG